jgi:hypothetical protein
VPRLDDQVGDRTGDRVHHDPGQLADVPVAAGDGGADGELCRACHEAAV